jgi:hypothetical protein
MPNSISSGANVSRRRFLYSSSLAAGALITGPHIARCASPGAKLNVAMIGVFNKGAENLKGMAGENIVALCDVDGGFLDKAGQQHSGAKRYRDWRKMLEQRDIEAVVVTIPDNSHAVAAMAALKLGKHVYCEKPLTHDVWEARQLTEAAQKYKPATQMGNGGHSSEGIRQCVEWVRAGVIGTVREVHTWSNRPIWPQGITRPIDTPPVPENLDWDIWLGPAPGAPVSSRLPSVQMARLVGFRHGRTWRHGLPHH